MQLIGFLKYLIQGSSVFLYIRDKQILWFSANPIILTLYSTLCLMLTFLKKLFGYKIPEIPQHELKPKAKKDTSFESETWKVLAMIIGAGVLFIMIVSTIALDKTATCLFSTNVQYYLTAMAVGLLIAGCCFCIGALLGFLFGIPRLLNASNIPDNLKAKNQIMQNDNLVQISDWITKIIVGVGLTQFYHVPPALMSLGTYLAPGFDHHDKSKLAENIAIVIVLYFLVIGFLCAYLWTRLYFSKMLAKNQNEIDNIQQELEAKEQELAQKADELSAKEKQLQEKKNEVQAYNTSFSEQVTELKSKRTESEWNDDPHKSQFGGKAESNGRIVSALVTPATFDKELFTVSLEVKSTDPQKPLTGEVVFYLHPTFKRAVQNEQVINGVAKLSLISYGAFTVGVECDGGATRLEIDLSELKDAPQLFKDR